MYPQAQVSKSRNKPPAAAGYIIPLPLATLCKPLFPPQAGAGETRQGPGTHGVPPQRAWRLHSMQPSADRGGHGTAGCTGAMGRMKIPFVECWLRGGSAPTGFPYAFSLKAEN